MSKDVKKIFDEALAPFPGAKWAACKLDFSEYQKDGSYNYAMIVYQPYDEVMTLDDYNETRQFELIRKIKIRIGELKKALTDACERENIPLKIPGISIDHMSPPYETSLSTKYIGVQAGIGWIGKNDLLVTYDYGTRIFTFGAVFYAENLELQSPVVKSECGDCDLCVHACPYHNIAGKTWEPGVTRDDLVNYHNCSVVRFNISEKLGLPRKWTCARCVLACPHGIDNIKKVAELEEKVGRKL